MTDENKAKLEIVSELLRSGATSSTVVKQAELIYNWVFGVDKAPAPAAEKPAPKVTETPAPAPKVLAEVPAPQVTITPIKDGVNLTTVPAPVVEEAQMSPEQLNEELNKEFTRLGGTEQNKEPLTLILGVMEGFGHRSVNTLPPADYEALLVKVRAL
jgi:hypothetical protein